MTKFNPRAALGRVLAARADATVNHEGGLAFELGPFERLTTRASTSFVSEDRFYESGAAHDAALVEDIRAVAAIDPEYPLRLAAYVRQVLNMRSVAVMLLVESARIGECRPFVRRWTPQIVRRADELTEVVAYWTTRVSQIGGDGPSGGANAFPNSLKKGLGDAFDRFDEYQLEKYNRKGAVKLRDVIRIGALPSDRAIRDWLLQDEVDEEALPKLAAKRRLLRKESFDEEARELARAASATWEVLSSKFGSTPEVWEFARETMPYMALLKNLRNLVRKGVDLDPVVAVLTDPHRVARSRLLPFEFLSAYREIEKLGTPESREALGAIARAMDLSTANLPTFTGRTAIAVDNSGSMDNLLSRRGSIRYSDVANTLGAIADSLSERAVAGSFGTDFFPVVANPGDSILTNVRRFAQADTCGMSTNAYRAVQYLRGDWEHGNLYDPDFARRYTRPGAAKQTTPIRVDRILILSDMQCYDTGARRGRLEHSLAEEVHKYRTEVNPYVFVYSVDLAGYGTAQIPPDDPRTMLLAGWSEQILSLIPRFESGLGTMVDAIRTWTPER